MARLRKITKRPSLLMLVGPVLRLFGSALLPVMADANCAVGGQPATPTQESRRYTLLNWITWGVTKFVDWESNEAYRPVALSAGYRLGRFPGLPPLFVERTWTMPTLRAAVIVNVTTGVDVPPPGAGLNTEIAGTGFLGEVMVIVALADLVGSATEVAVTVTVLGVGTAPGAV